MRSPGRRYWESHWHIRLAGAIAIAMLSVSVWFTFSRVEELRNQRPHNPHFSDKHCGDCHENKDPKTGKQLHAISSEECYECHDGRSRQLMPNAFAKLKERSPDGACIHDLRRYASVVGAEKIPVTALCLHCHKAFNGYVAMMNISTKKYIEVDIARTHPIGQMPTETVYPKTLPLSHETGAISCITCHDQHGNDRRLHLLRLYYPGNGHPPDFRPLCNDCHEDGWIPLKGVRADIVKEVPRRDD